MYLICVNKIIHNCTAFFICRNDYTWLCINIQMDRWIRASCAYRNGQGITGHSYITWSIGVMKWQL